MFNPFVKAAIFLGSRAIQVQQVPPPEPGAGQVLVRIVGCGICHSNVPVFEGREWFHYPLPPGQPGHEGWGVVEDVGPGVEDLRAGQRVALLSERAYAEYDVASAESVVALPEELADRPFPGEPLACAMNILARSDVREGQTVAVVGIGFLGALLTSLVSRRGARVVAVSRRPFALEVARGQGAERTFSLSSPEKVKAEVAEITGGRGCERVIECVGRQEALDLAGDLTGVRGRLVIAGYHQDGPRRVNLQQWNWRGLDVINAHERDPEVYVQGMRKAVAAVVAGTLDPFPLLTHRFPLDRLAEGLEATASRPEGFLKGWVAA